MPEAFRRIAAQARPDIRPRAAAAFARPAPAVFTTDAREHRGWLRQPRIVDRLDHARIGEQPKVLVGSSEYRRALHSTFGLEDVIDDLLRPLGVPTIHGLRLATAHTW
jgi:hypothetical protein